VTCAETESDAKHGGCDPRNSHGSRSGAEKRPRGKVERTPAQAAFEEWWDAGPKDPPPCSHLDCNCIERQAFEAGWNAANDRQTTEVLWKTQMTYEQIA